MLPGSWLTVDGGHYCSVSCKVRRDRVLASLRATPSAAVSPAVRCVGCGELLGVVCHDTGKGELCCSVDCVRAVRGEPDDPAHDVMTPEEGARELVCLAQNILDDSNDFGGECTMDDARRLAVLVMKVPAAKVAAVEPERTAQELAASVLTDVVYALGQVRRAAMPDLAGHGLPSRAKDSIQRAMDALERADATLRQVVEGVHHG